MKKTLLTAAAAFIALAAVSGCSSEETPSANAGILDATAAVESCTGVTEINMTASSDGNKISMGTTGNISLKAEPFFADMDVNITANDSVNAPVETNTRLILEQKDETNTVYLLDENGEWLKEVVDTEDFRVAASQYDVMENGSTFMSSASNMQVTGTETVNGRQVSVYEGTIPRAILSDVLEITGSTALVGTNIGPAYYEECEDLPVKIWVDEADVIVGYEADLTDTVQSLFNKLYEENDITDPSMVIQIESYTAGGTVDDYNCDIDTSLPQEALSAQEVNSEGETK